MKVKIKGERYADSQEQRQGDRAEERERDI